MLANCTPLPVIKENPSYLISNRLRQLELHYGSDYFKKFLYTDFSTYNNPNQELWIHLNNLELTYGTVLVKTQILSLYF